MRPEKFIFIYSLGNLLSMSATIFLFGPKTLWRNMTNPTRRTVTIVFFTAMSVSIVTALTMTSSFGRLLTLVAVGVQMCAYWWYSLSYIPFGRKILTTCCKCMYRGLEDL